MSDCYAGIPDEVLDSTWSDADLARLAQHVVSWEELAPFWGLTEAEEEVIKKDNPRYTPQKLAALRKWKAKSPETATYRQLIRVLKRMGKMGLVEKVREIVLSPEEVPAGGPGDVLSGYREFLEKSCSQLPHPGMLTHQWPIIKSPAYVQLPLSKRRRPQRLSMEHWPTSSSMFLSSIMRSMSRRKNENSECEIQEVDLSQLLGECSGGTIRSIVIRGVPGAGKTTLSWHAYQQWAKRESFQQFSLFLLIPLCTTRVQQAACLADLVPHPDSEQRKAVAQAISASDGDNVCFWFDGWDEMPQEVQRESFVASFIRRDSPGCSLPRCTTVVTTRPESSNLNSSEEIWINALSIDQVNEIITKSIEGTDHNPSDLISRLEKNTSLQSFCLTVPINVAILISLFFLFKSGLPDTQTQLFKCLVLNLLLHNLQLRWKLSITSLKSFAALPDSPAESFRSICEIAFNGVMNTKTVFLGSDVPSLQNERALSASTLGLMEISPRMEWYGVEEELTFLHTTLQEFLAAVHLTTLENEEQVRIVQVIVNSESSYRKSILQFYVGQVGLDNSEVFSAMLQKCRVTLNSLGPSSFNHGESGLSPFVTFVNCVFEAQSGQLCQELTQNKNLSISKEFDLCLTFELTHFNTADFSRLGYFIGWFCKKKTCELTFHNCYITPQQFDVFVNQVKQVWSNELHRPSLSLLVSESYPTVVSVEFQCERIRALCGLIKEITLVSHFNIQFPFNCMTRTLDSQELKHYFTTMKSIVEAFASNTSCSDLILRYEMVLLFRSNFTMFKVTCYSEYYALLLLTFSRHLKRLAFHNFFQLHYNYPLFSCALRYTNILHLDFFVNQLMCEALIANIADALSFNLTVKTVTFGNWLTTEELRTFLIIYGRHYGLPVQSGLERVYVGHRAHPAKDSKSLAVIGKINLIRKLVSACQFLVIKSIDRDTEDWIPVYYVAYDGFDTYVRGEGRQ